MHDRREARGEAGAEGAPDFDVAHDQAQRLELAARPARAVEVDGHAPEDAKPGLVPEEDVRLAPSTAMTAQREPRVARGLWKRHGGDEPGQRESTGGQSDPHDLRQPGDPCRCDGERHTRGNRDDPPPALHDRAAEVSRLAG